MDLDHPAIRYWLALLRCPGIGSRRFHELLLHFPKPETLFLNPPDELQQCKLPAKSLKWIQNPDWREVDKDLTWLDSSPHHHILTLEDSRYPGLLKEIDDAPPILFVLGDNELLNQPQLGMVGSRNPSPGGLENAHRFSKSLASAGLTITSGMALGIDAAAHTGALDATGATIAVTGTGLDRVYPARHKKLAHQIAEHGALVSEFSIGTPPLANHFPRRNRIISGLSLGTLVVEATPQSGSLITARLAAEQGREVFAIPGSIHNPMAKGCHSLIRQGAKLVENLEDILEELGTLIAFNDIPAPTHTPEIESKQLLLIEKIGHDPISIDALVERSRLTTEEVSSILLELELQGMVSCAPGGLYFRH